MRHCLRTLLTVLLAISLTLTGLALAEEGLELGLAVEGPEEMEALPELALEDGALAIDGAALVTEDVAANADGDEIVAKINKSNFPAADFRKYVLANIDSNGDKKLSKAEAEAVTELMLRTWEDKEAGRNAYNLSSLKGVEYFTNLEQLECVACKVKTLDVTKNTKLEELDCSENRLTKLDVSKCTELDELRCGSNKLSKLDVTKCARLTELDVADNQLSRLDVTNNTKLVEPTCSGNGLTSLDVRSCKALHLLHAWENRLKKLDVTKNAKLEQLRLFGNQLTALDVTKNTRLTHMNLTGNRLKALDVTKNTKLIQLNANQNRLTALDVSKNPKLKFLYTNGNAIKTLDIKNNKILRGYLKNKVWEEEDGIYWSFEGDDGLWGLGIDYSTTLTSGKKVLYQGR